MKPAVKGKYDSTKGLTYVIPADYLTVGTFFTASYATNNSAHPGLVLGVQKPGFFIANYNVLKENFRFQFMSSVRVSGKWLNMTCIHETNDNRTMVDGTLVLDPANKVSVNHTLGSKNGMFKYTYVSGGGVSFQPGYDLEKSALNFAVSRKVFADDVVRASYHACSKVFGLQWVRNFRKYGCFKVGASVNLAEEVKKPRLSFESSWNMKL